MFSVKLARVSQQLPKGKVMARDVLIASTRWSLVQIWHCFKASFPCYGSFASCCGHVFSVELAHVSQQLPKGKVIARDALITNMLYFSALNCLVVKLSLFFLPCRDSFLERRGLAGCCSLHWRSQMFQSSHAQVSFLVGM